MDPENIVCRRSEETAAYLDRELGTKATLLFEAHLQECSYCAVELQEQRRLLCALDLALCADAPCVTLPREFAQIVAANAESDMSGVRKRSEHKRALALCLGLLLVSVALLGGGTLYAAVSVPIRAFAKSFAGIFGFLWTAFYDAGAGAAVIMRALSRHLIFESYPTILVSCLLFTIAITLLPRLIVKYHRARISE